MKLVLFQTAGANDILPGLITDRGVVSVAGAVKLSYTPQLTMQGIIDDFDRLKPALTRLAADGSALSLDAVRLHPPLPGSDADFRMRCLAGTVPRSSLSSRSIGHATRRRFSKSSSP